MAIVLLIGFILTVCYFYYKFALLAYITYHVLQDDHQKACSIGKDHGFLSSSFNNAPQKADVAQSEAVLYSHLVSMSSYI